MAWEPGTIVPQFVVTTIDGSRFDYSQIWQRRNLLLIVWPRDGSEHLDAYVAKALGADVRDAYDAAVVVTQDDVPGVSAPTLLVADRWGEVYFVAAPATVAELPDAHRVREWLRSVDGECPECQGEAR